jgi:uncharacterized tellurite resistance protein B-like protein
MNPAQKVDLLRAACCVAGIDGQATEAEMNVIQRMVRETGVGKASLQAMIDRSTKDPEFYKEQFRVLKADPTEAMTYLIQVAMADGKLTAGEIEVMQKLGEKLDVPHQEFQKLITQVREML